MKKLFSLILLAATATAVAQPKKAPKMAPTMTDGYVIGNKGDTIRGMVQSNPEDETDFYHKFGFIPATKPGSKVVIYDTKKTKAYGYDGRHFIVITEGGEDAYVERLVSGRLNFYEYRFNGKINGNPAIESTYYIQDTRSDDASLKEIKKISNTFYKKDLKPYMKDQLMIWTDLDKFTFNKAKVVEALREYNKFYVQAAEVKEE